MQHLCRPYQRLLEEQNTTVIFHKLSGEEISLLCRADDLVVELKRRLQAEHDIPDKQIRLLSGETCLQDHLPLCAQGCPPGGTSRFDLVITSEPVCIDIEVNMEVRDREALDNIRLPAELSNHVTHEEWRELLHNKILNISESWSWYSWLACLPCVSLIMTWKWLPLTWYYFVIVLVVVTVNKVFWERKQRDNHCRWILRNQEDLGALQGRVRLLPSRSRRVFNPTMVTLRYYLQGE